MTNLLDNRLEDILSRVFDEMDEDLIVVNPSGGAIESIVEVGTTFEGELPSIRLLAEERTLKDVMDDFIVASNTADLVDAGVMSLRTSEAMPANSLLVTRQRVIALVDAGTHVAGLTDEDGDFVDAAWSYYNDHWDSADEFSLRTPPISQVRQSLEDDIGPEAEDDFDHILTSLETARGDGDGLDEVTISLLVAAKNEALLYDISKWGEDVGIASKATFSRTKTRLEDMGLIDTEKVPIDVGRPRLRLKLGDERLANADNGQLATVAQSILN
jgi:hypothetical protein